MNLANKLTLFRVILIPVFIVFILLRVDFPWASYAATGVFLLASFTDFLDGHIARKRHIVTNFGKFMDPLADKLLVCSALICLTYLSGEGHANTSLPVWVTVLIVAREFIISGFRLVACEKGVVLAASKIAKVKTVSQMVMIIFLILDLPFTVWSVISTVFIYLAFALTVISLLDYLIRNWYVMKDEKN